MRLYNFIAILGRDPNRTMAFAKLLRGIGLGVVLTAWFLEWGLVKPFEQFASVMGAANARYDAVLEQIEKDRRVHDSVFAAAKPEDDLVDLRLRAWNSPFYRSQWFKDTVTFLSIVNAANSAGRTVEQQYGHPPSKLAEKIEAVVRSVQQKMLKGVDSETRRLLVEVPTLHLTGAKKPYSALGQTPELPFVDSKKLTVTDFTEINRLLQELRVLTLTYSRSTSDLVTSTASAQSKWHRFAFGFGSLLVVGGTVLEAAAERRKAKATGSRPVPMSTIE